MNPSFKLCWHPRKFLCFHGNCAKPFTGGDIRRVVSHLNRLTLTWDGCHFDYLQVLTVNVTVGLELVWNIWMVSKRSKSIYKDYETAYRIIIKKTIIWLLLYCIFKWNLLQTESCFNNPWWRGHCSKKPPCRWLTHLICTRFHLLAKS